MCRISLHICWFISGYLSQTNGTHFGCFWYIRTWPHHSKIRTGAFGNRKANLPVTFAPPRKCFFYVNMFSWKLRHLISMWNNTLQGRALQMNANTHQSAVNRFIFPSQYFDMRKDCKRNPFYGLRGFLPSTKKNHDSSIPWARFSDLILLNPVIRLPTRAPWTSIIWFHNWLYQ